MCLTHVSCFRAFLFLIIMCQTKICTKCKEEKELKDFHVRAKAPDGRRGVCKDCKNYRNREKRLEYQEREKIILDTDIKTCCTCKSEKTLSCFRKHISMQFFLVLHHYHEYL